MDDKRRSGNTPKNKKEAKTHRVSKKTPPSKKEVQLRKKLDAAESEIHRLRDRLLRAAAELDNFRKRTEREIIHIINNANEGIIKDLLPIIDDVERSLKSAPKGGKGREFYKGVDLIYQKLMTVLGKYGLEPMESIGRDFDVDQHDALLQVAKEGIPSSTVVDEHEKGYLLNGKVIRHAKVVVSK
jgi:molecular chaperone GrpE